MTRIAIIAISLLLQITPINVFADEFIDPFATQNQTYIDPFSTEGSESKEISTNPAFVHAIKNRERNKITKKAYQCILDNLKNVGSDIAARMISTACLELNRE